MTSLGRAAPTALPATRPAVPAVSVKGLTRHRPDRRGTLPARGAPANDRIDLAVGRGECLAVLGHNGAGKTTLLRQIAGVLRPDAGRIALFGHDITARPSRAPLLMAYLAQDEPALGDLPVGVALETTGRMRGLGRAAARAAAAELLDELALDGLTRRPLRQLSGGQRRLAQFGCALIGDRPLLLLDEPTAGLDRAARAAVWDALRRRKASSTVVVVTHDPDDAGSVLDRCAVVNAGRLLHRGPDAADTSTATATATATVRVAWALTPPAGDPDVEALRARSAADGPLWTAAMEPAAAGRLLAAVLDGPAAAAVAEASVIRTRVPAARPRPTASRQAR